MKVEGTQVTPTENLDRYRYARPSVETGGSTFTIDIYIEKLPEGVFLGTSLELPGLTVEADTRDEMIKEARKVALAMLEVEGREEKTLPRFRFIEFA